MGLDRTATRYFRVLLIVLLVTISYLAFTPRHFPLIERIWDKLNHAAAFTTLAFALDFSFPHRKYGAPKILALLAYGMGIEVVQHFLPWRDFELWDVVADGAGLLLYGLSQPLLQKLPVLRKRWTA